MREVHDYLEEQGACIEALEIFSDHGALTLTEFFSEWYDGGLVPERTHARWSYWLSYQYYDKDVFPENIMGLCIELSFSKDHKMPEMQALKLFRKIKDHMPAEERKWLRSKFRKKLPNVETREDR